MMPQLIDLLAEDGEELCRAASAIGGKIEFCPHQALERDTNFELQAPSQWSPNGNCRLIKAQSGWFAANLAREDDRLAVPAWTGSAPGTDPWDALVQAAAARDVEEMVAAGLELHLPVSRVYETAPLPSPVTRAATGVQRRARPKVVDLSALWAGPYCGGLLAQTGMDVTRIESTTRPDPTPDTSPLLDQHINGGKMRVWLPPDDALVSQLIVDSDILITSARKHSLARLGLSEDRLFELNPGLIWVAITAHGWSGEGEMRVGFGDDCAAAGGLVTWQNGHPNFMGDALADPLAGIAAATIAMQMLSEGQGGLVDIALARTAAQMAARLGLR